MNSRILIGAAALAFAAPVYAQEVDANSESNSVAVSGSESHSGAISDQSQGQSLQNTNQLGATQGNQQGVSTAITFNSTNHKRSYVGTNAAIPLAASSSFSSDYCGGTASGGVSAAPIGISIGGAGPTFDKSCQSLRRAEKFGMAAANWHNLGYPERAVAMMRMMEWSICTSDSKGPKPDTSIAEACDRVLNMNGSPPSAPAPKVSAQPEVPASVAPTEVDKYKTPRGDNEYFNAPIKPGTVDNPVAMATIK